MRIITTLILLAVLTGCSTSAGLVKGLGEDIKTGTDWASSKIKSS